MEDINIQFEYDPMLYEHLVMKNKKKTVPLRSSLEHVNTLPFACNRETRNNFSYMVKFMIQYEMEQLVSKIITCKNIRNNKTITDEDVLKAIKLLYNTECIYLS